jgi:hypothetical protein
MTEDVSDILEAFIQSQLVRMSSSSLKEEDIRRTVIYDVQSWADWYHEQMLAQASTGKMSSMMQNPKVRRTAQLAAVYEVAQKEGKAAAVMFKLAMED